MVFVNDADGVGENGDLVAVFCVADAVAVADHIVEALGLAVHLDLQQSVSISERLVVQRLCLLCRW